MEGNDGFKGVSRYDGDQVLQCYARYEGETFEKPRCQLVAIQRIHLTAGMREVVKMQISHKALESVLENGNRTLLEGKYTLFIGFSQPDERSVTLSGQKPKAIRLYVSNGEILKATPAEYRPLAYADSTCYAAKMEESMSYGLHSLVSALGDKMDSQKLGELEMRLKSVKE